MKKQRILPMLIIILLTLITLSAVSAAEDAASDITGIDENDEISLEQSALDDANEEPILEESPDDENNLANTDETLLGEATGTFTDLNNLINGATNFEINLTRDYAYNSSSDSDFKYGVRIDHGIIINGNGHTLNGSGEARIFTVVSNEVILRNINFVGGHATSDYSEANGGAIDGRAIAINCTFTNNRADDEGEAMYDSIAINCTFTNNGKGKAIYACAAIYCKFNNGDSWDTASCTISNRLFIEVDSYESFYNSGEPYYVDVKYSDDPDDLIERLKMNIAFYNNDSQIVKNESIYTGQSEKFYLNLTPGNYIARVSAAYIPEISPAAFIINITKANSTITVSNITGPYGKENYLYATLLENPGSPVSNAAIRVSVNGSETDYVTDGNGKIAIPLKDLPLGTHTVTLTFGGDDCYNGNATTAEITIIKGNSAINCNNTYTLPYNSSAIVIELKNTDLDKTISGVTLSVDINGSIENYTTNEYGQIEVPINMLNSGNYTATITYAGNETIEGKSKTISIIIKQQKSYIACENVTTLYNSDANIVATLTNDQGNPIIGAVIKIDLFARETFKTDANGQIAVPSSRLAAGEYNAEIIFEGETNYEAASQHMHISISKDTATLSAVNVTTEFGKDDTLVISLKDSQNRPIANVKLIVFIANFEEKTTDAMGGVKISAKDMEIGVHNIAVLFNGNENYTSSNTTAMINVTKITPIVTVEDYRISWGEMAILNITVKDENGNPVEGVVKVVFPGYGGRYTYYATINETGKGQAKFIAEMDPDDYRITTTFMDNDYYNKADKNSLFTVTESKILNLEITANEAVSGEDTILTVKGTDGRGKSVTINNLDIKVGDNDMKNYDVTGKTVNLGKLATGLTPVQISYRGDYYPTSVNITVNVLKIIPVMTVIGSVVPSGNVSTVKIKVTDENNNPVKGTVTVTVDHGIVSRDTVELDENGNGVVKFSINNTGTFVIMAKFLGDENYSSIVNDTENLTVTANNNITFNAEINENLTEIIISDAKDKDTGQTVNGIIAGSLIKDEDMIVLENITLSQGKGIIKIPEGLKPGTYKAYLILVTEDDKYAFNYDVEFTVVKLATAIDVKDVTVTTVNEAIEGEVVEYFNFTLKDSKGYALANKDVQVKMDGVTYNLTTDANGVAKIKIDLSKAKTYNLAIFYPGDNDYLASFEQARITVNAQVPALTANSPTYLATATSKSITSTLKDAKGNALANKNVTFTVNGKTYKATTDAKGQATVKLSLTAANTYAVKINFAGDSIYAASTVSAKVKLNKEKTKINAPKKTFKKAKKVKKVVITLKNSKGKVLANKKVTLTVNKKTYTAKTNAKGKATFKVKNLKKKGNKKYTVKFAGDSQYQAVKKTGKIKIK